MVMAQMLTGPISGIIGEHGGWRLSFVALGLFAIATGATLAVRFGRSLWQRPETPGLTAVPGPVAYLRLLKRPIGQWLLLSAFFDGLCLFGGAFPYTGAFMMHEFGLDAAMTGLIVASFGVGSFIYTRFARPLVRRFGEGNLLLIGGLGVSAGLVGLALTPSWPVAAAMQVVTGLTFYMFHGVLQARATEALPEARGAAVSAFALALFLGQGTGALAFGGLLGANGYRFGFMTAAIAMLVVTILCRLGLAALRRQGRMTT
jgi:DHA1 family inner membrane transport protein